jgi:multicomponent Na+:H+ antiporter subunit D
MVVKSTLFLCCGLIERYEGTDELDRLGGLLKRDPWLAALFFLAALSLAGLPPLSGFFGKLLLLGESVRMRGTDGYTLAAIAVVTSLLTLLSMLKIWSFAFWSPAPSGGGRRPRPQGRGAGLTVIAAMVLLALSVGFGAEHYLKVARVAARGVLDPRPYVTAVLGPDRGGKGVVAEVRGKVRP